jgi:ATP-dependent DNA helicase MPH1
VFLAPTKPLVAQQLVACRDDVAIPQDACAELTGETKAERRRQLWGEKRVFFMTYQTLHNDLQAGDVPAEDIVLLVVDECHRASSSSKEVPLIADAVRLLEERQQRLRGAAKFRILGLSATPGSTQRAIEGLVRNLRVSK